MEMYQIGLPLIHSLASKGFEILSGFWSFYLYKLIQLLANKLIQLFENNENKLFQSLNVIASTGSRNNKIKDLKTQIENFGKSPPFFHKALLIHICLFMCLS